MIQSSNTDKVFRRPLLIMDYKTSLIVNWQTTNSTIQVELCYVWRNTRLITVKHD